MANEHSQIVPSMQPTAKVADFKFWCQKVLPLVYDDSLSYYEVLNKMVVYLNQVIDDINADIDNVEELKDDFLLLQTYVNNFFDDIDQLVTYAERAEAAETAALGSAASAAESATNAASSAVNAATSSGSAATSALSAMDAKDAAIVAKTAAEAALASAQSAATNAAASATSASGSATNAATSAASALQNFQLSDAARTAAQSAAVSAESDAADAADSAAEAVAAVDTVINGLGNIAKIIENVPIATTEDALASIAKKLVVDIEPVQSGSGDPAPDNVRPITGWTGANVVRAGKNLIELKLYSGCSYNPAIGSTWTLIESSIQFSNPSFGVYKVLFPSAWTSVTLIAPVKYGETYRLSYSRTATGPTGSSWGYLDENFNVLTVTNNTDIDYSYQATWTPNENCKYIYLLLTSRGTANIEVTITNPQLELGSNTTEYDEFKGQTIPITFPVEADTVYGATLINLGTDEWKLKVNMAMKEYDGSSDENWAYSSSYTLTDTAVFYSNSLPNAEYLSWSIAPEIITNMFVAKSRDDVHYLDTPCVGYTGTVGESASPTVRCLKTTASTLAEFISFLSETPLMFCYKLATPIEYTITEAQALILLSGINNVWADTGNINTLEYFTNAENYVTSQIDLAKSLIAPVLKEMIADTALVANDFRIVGNTLYRITGNVASGGTLTPNTNCVATTVGAILKSLLSA